MGIVNVRHALVAGLAAAGLAGSACSNGAASETRSWPTPSPVSADVPVWADVSGQGVEAPRDSTQYRAQYGSAPAPGIEIVHAKSSAPGDTVPCTLGPAVSSGYLTAGHCAKGATADQYLVGSPTGDLNLLGVANAVADPVDAAVIRTSAAATTTIAGTWPVAGVLTRAGVRDLVKVGDLAKPGDPVCFNGAVSGVRCGARMPDEDGMVQFGYQAQPGDSGSPVFVVDGKSRAVLIGIVKSAGGAATDATYLDDVLFATGTSARLAPRVEAFDGPAPGQVSPRFVR